MQCWAGQLMAQKQKEKENLAQYLFGVLKKYKDKNRTLHLEA